MSNQLRSPVPYSREGWTWPSKVRSFFVTNGAADPTLFSGDIQSVTRVNSDGGQPIYRVLYKSARPFRVPADQATMMQLGEDRLRPVIITGQAAADYTRNVDIQVRDDAAGAFTNSVAAGRRVILDLWDEGY